MTPDRLLGAFETLADGPEGITRLRELVLRLAVQGNLVSQDSADEPARELVERIHREQLVSSTNGLSPVKVSDVPWDIPKDWEWVRLRQVVDFSIGKTPPTKNARFWADEGQGYAWVGIADMRHYEVVQTTSRRVTEEAATEVFRGPPKPQGTILMSFKLTIGKIARLGCPAYHNEAIISVFPALQELDPFLYRFLQVFAAASDTNAAIKGATLNKASLTNLLVALPPIAEQKRIVARLDELMALLGRLEAAQDSREATRQALRDAALSALRDADDTETLQSAWTRVASHMDEIVVAAEDVSSLRSAILQLAIQGRLTPQDPGDEPADTLLARISKEKHRLVKERKIKKTKPISPRESSEVPFEIPAGWKWVHIDDVCEDSFYGPRFGKHEYIDSGVPTIRTTDMTTDGRIVLREPPCVRVPEGKMDLYRVRPGDLLVTRSGSIGVMAVFRGDYAALPSAYLIRFRFMEGILPEYIYRVLSSPYGQEALGLASTTMAQPNVSATSIRQILAPIPPQLEQQRIASRVAELMAICDDLEARLEQSRATQSLFASSAFASLV